MARQEWQELYKMMAELSRRLEATDLELAKTQTLIRDYNSLRERIDECERNVQNITGQAVGSREMWGYVIGGAGILFALISYMSK